MSQPVPIEIDVQSVNQMRQTGEPFLLLDCRETTEFELAKIHGSVLIPMGQLQERIGELEPHRDGRVVVHCHHGGRSLRVVHWLRKNGFNLAQNMSGGIDAWSLQIDPATPRY